MSANLEGLRKSSFFHILIITTLAIGLYLNTLKNGFVYDDELTIVNNTLINSFDNLPLLFDKTAYFIHSGEISYRPIVTFTYFIDYALYSLKPWGYHLTNVLLHAINGVLLYIFLTLLLTPGTVPILRLRCALSVNRDSPLSHSSRLTSPPFLISLLFVTHPVLTEAVNCISYREDLLAFLFYMTTLSLYLILRQPASDHRPQVTVFLYILSCFTYFFALLSKEMAVTLPLIVICYEWLYGREKAKLPSRLFNRYTLGYMVITLFYIYLRFYLFHNPEEQLEAWSLVERFLTLPWLIVSYIKLSLFPVQLSADYVINPVGSPFSPIFILSLIALVSVLTAILIRGNREKTILFGTLFFLITLMPVYNIVPLINPFAERYLYLPLVGIILSAVYIAYFIAQKLKIKPMQGNRYMPTVLFIALLPILSFYVVKRNTIWKDNYSLWSDTVAKMPDSARTHNNLGRAYEYQERFNEAIREYLTAIKLNVKAHNNLGAKAHNNLGVVYFKQGRYDEAISEYLAAIKLNFDNAKAHNNLGAAYLKQGRYDEAIYELKTTIMLKPDYADAYYNLGITYGRQGLFDQAIEELLTAIRLKPDDAGAHYSLGIVYSRQGRYDEAISEFSMALKLRPDYKEAYYNLEALMNGKKGYKDTENATVDQDRNWSP